MDGLFVWMPIADYFMMEPRLKDKYCEYTLPIGFHSYWETGKGEVTIGDK